MKATRQAKKSAARTKHQIMMDRLRSGVCITCGGPKGDRTINETITIKVKDDTCGTCRWKEMQNV